MKGTNIVIFVLLLLNSIIDAKGGRGSSGGSRGSSSSRSSSSRGSSSGGGWFGSSSRSSPSYSRPSPSYSYSRPSPSYTYSRPSPSYSYSPSYSPSSPSYGWNTGGSSFGASKPSSTNYGWNIGSNTGSSSTGSKPSSSSYGWNIGSNTGSSNTASKPSSTGYGWNIGSNTGSSSTGSKPASTGYGWGSNTGSSSSGSKPAPSAPVGPPPSYPGMQSNPVPSYNKPPSYSPSYNNPPSYSPAHFNTPSYNSPSYRPSPSYSSSYSSPSYRPSPSYSPSYSSPSYRPSPSYSPSYRSPSYNSKPSPSYSSNIPKQNVYGTHTSSPGYFTNSHQNYYGNAFGNQGVPPNTYISNNYYGNQKSGGSGFLTNAMFLGAGAAGGYGLGRLSSHNNYGNDYYGNHGYYGNNHYDGYGNNYYGHSNYGRSYSPRRWDEDEDRRWRETTRAPYFENKVPGEDKILPASAVIGAATAFGLASLLPLNVPSDKPLLYCNSTDLMQSPIRINNDYIYRCVNGSIVVSCFKESDINTTKIVEDQKDVGSNQTFVDANQTEVLTNQTEINQDQTELTANQTKVIAKRSVIDEIPNESIGNQTEVLETSTVLSVNQTDAPQSQTDPKCSSNIMQCDLPDTELLGNIYCKKDTLMSKSFIFCNSTMLLNNTIIINGTSINTTTTILNCYEGQLSDKQASFIPTTTQAPVITTEKPLSFGAKARLFFLRIIGKGDIVDKKQNQTSITEDIPQLADNETWIPEALTIPPSTTEIATTEAPFEYMVRVTKKYENGTVKETLKPISKELVEAHESHNKLLEIVGSTTSEPYWIKVYQTTTELSESTSTTEAPFEWMMYVNKQYENGSSVRTLEPVLEDLVKLQEENNRMLEAIGSTTSKNYWVKVYKTTTELPESTISTSTTEAPYDWMIRVTKKYENGTVEETLKPVLKELVEMNDSQNKMLELSGRSTPATPFWIKVYRTTTQASIETTTESISTTTVAFDGPFEYMRKTSDNGTDLEPVPKDLLDLIQMYNYSIPSDWVKVPKNENLETTTLEA